MVRDSGSRPTFLLESGPVLQSVQPLLPSEVVHACYNGLWGLIPEKLLFIGRLFYRKAFRGRVPCSSDILSRLHCNVSVGMPFMSSLTKSRASVAQRRSVGLGIGRSRVRNSLELTVCSRRQGNQSALLGGPVRWKCLIGPSPHHCSSIGRAQIHSTVETST